MWRVRQRFSKSGFFLFALIGALFISLVVAPAVSAEGEQYQYIEGDDTIRMSGGVLSGKAIGLEKKSGGGFGGGDSYSTSVSIPGSISRRTDGNKEDLNNPCTYTIVVSDIDGDLSKAGNEDGEGHKASVSFTRSGSTTLSLGKGGCLDGGELMQQKKIGADIVVSKTGLATDAIPRGCEGSTKNDGPTLAPDSAECKAAVEKANAENDTNNEKEEPDICPVDKRNAFRWFFCPFTDIAQSFADGMDYFIEKYLRTDNQIFLEPGEEGYQAGYRKAWETFRSFGIALVIIAGIVMVASEALNLSIVDAYTVRKVLPRLLVAAVGIAVSWDLMRFLVGFFDALGHAASSIIYTSFQQKANDTSVVSLGGTFLANALGIIGIGAVGVGAAVVAPLLGALGVIAILCSIVLALMVGMTIVLARQAIIVVCILLAPLAIAAYILPNTNKLANFWWNTFISMMLLYPIATGLIALCKVLGMITANNEGDGSGGVFATISGVILYFLGYALFPVAFRLSGGLMSAIYNLGSDKSGGAFKFLRNVRNNQVKGRYARLKAGDDSFAGGKFSGAFIRRATTRGGIASKFLPAKVGGRSIPGISNIQDKAQARYDAANQLHANKVTDDMLKHDNNRGAGHDAGNHLLLKDNMNFDKYVAERSQGLIQDGTYTDVNAARAHARREAATFESSYKTSIGSEGSRLVAARALNLSNKGYDFKYENDDHKERDKKLKYRMDTGQRIQDLAKLSSENVINTTDATTYAKSNKGRWGTSEISFGTLNSVMGTVEQRMRTGTKVDELDSKGEKNVHDFITNDEIDKLGSELVRDAGPRAIVGGRHEDTSALMPYLLENVESQLLGADDNKLLDTLADLDGMQTLMGQAGGKESRIIADGLMSRMVTDTKVGRYENGKLVAGSKNERVTVQELLRRAREMPGEEGTGRQRVRERTRQFVNDNQNAANEARKRNEEAAEAAGGGAPV